MFGRVEKIDKARYVREVSNQRRAKDRFFATSPQSPVPYQYRSRSGQFTGLNYYPPDPAFRVTAEVVLFDQPEIVRLATSTGEIRPQERSAELRFRIGAHDLRLSGFSDPHQQHPHELFVPFRDAASGHETYGAGRYLEVAVERHGDGSRTATIDFNLAYNPYCAYSDNYSCPIPPRENCYRSRSRQESGATLKVTR